MSMNNQSQIEQALNGEILIGDEYSLVEIEQWFEDEKEGYYNLYYAGQEPIGESSPGYEYSELAEQHGFRWLPSTHFESALGIGSAHGAELRPILARSGRITVLEPSDGFSSNTIDGKDVTYIKPQASGLIPFEDESFDLIVCFSVLHHIPNVSTVIGEMHRVLKRGGWILLREPTHSMGDWRKPRRGLTKRERGIPLNIFRNIVTSTGLQIVRETRCMFSLMTRLSPLLQGKSVWTFSSIVKLDRIVCSIPVWPNYYGASRLWHKIRPTAVSYVLHKK